MAFLDTQIISYAYKGIGNYKIYKQKVCSIVISEFLKQYIENEFTSARFYPRLVHRYDFGYHFKRNKLSQKHSNILKRRTDSILIDFNGSYPSIIEYGSLAFHFAFKYRNKEIILGSIAHLEKEYQKEISNKLDFLFEHDISCYSLNKVSIITMFSLLARFEKNNINLKKNFRNSINDLLIASISICNNEHLVTNDNLLIKEIVSDFDLTTKKNNDGTIDLFSFYDKVISSVKMYHRSAVGCTGLRTKVYR